MTSTAEHGMGIRDGRFCADPLLARFTADGVAAGGGTAGGGTAGGAQVGAG
jgi:hypothetical protein